MNAITIAAVVTGSVTIIGALTTAIISIITTLRSTKEVVIAAAEANRTRGIVRDNKIQEIHLLVNSRLLTVLRLLVSVSKQLAELTGKKEDIASYEAAKAELTKAELSASTVSSVNAEQTNHEEQDAKIADIKINELLNRIKVI